MSREFCYFGDADARGVGVGLGCADSFLRSVDSDLDSDLVSLFFAGMDEALDEPTVCPSAAFFCEPDRDES